LGVSLGRRGPRINHGQAVNHRMDVDIRPHGNVDLELLAVGDLVTGRAGVEIDGLVRFPGLPTCTSLTFLNRVRKEVFSY
jgi:hypothetical protein